MTHLRNLKLERQQYAFECANQVEDQKLYKARCEDLAMMVYTNSLLSAAALLKEGKEAEKELYGHIQGWLQKDGIGLIQSDLLVDLTAPSMTSSQLRLCTKEVMLLADHLKEMCQALPDTSTSRETSNEPS